MNYMKRIPEYVKYAASVVPSERQIKWQEMEFYAFFHFGINTFNMSDCFVSSKISLHTEQIRQW